MVRLCRKGRIFRKDGDLMAVLCMDLGGTKLLAALVEQGRILASLQVPTSKDGQPGDWLDALGEAAASWKGKYERIGAAVTGIVEDGKWSALNPATLAIPAGFELGAAIFERFGLQPTLVNDAQAAAFGEYAVGAGGREDMVYLTVSTGLGGGMVLGGRLVSGSRGLAGHFGQTGRGSSAPLEDSVTGRWIASEALKAGHRMEAPGVFSAARDGNAWAQSIMDRSAARVAALCVDIQLTIDPARIVIGGGIGLAEGYLAQVQSHLTNQPEKYRPAVFHAALGVNAGVLGLEALIDI